MKFLFDNDNKIIFKKIAMIAIVFGILNGLMLGNLVTQIIDNFGGLFQELAGEYDDVLTALESDMLTELIEDIDVTQATDFLVNFLFVAGGLLIANVFYFIFSIIFLRRGIESLNDEIKFTEFPIKKRTIFIALILSSISTFVISFIPTIGSALSMYLVVIFYDVYLIKNLRAGTMNLNLSAFNLSLKKHKFFALKAVLTNLVIGFANVGILIFLILLGVALGLNNFSIIMIIISVISVLLYAYYTSAVLTYLIKNPSEIEEQELIDADKY